MGHMQKQLPTVGAYLLQTVKMVGESIRTEREEEKGYH